MVARGGIEPPTRGFSGVENGLAVLLINHLQSLPTPCCSLFLANSWHIQSEFDTFAVHLACSYNANKNISAFVLDKGLATAAETLARRREFRLPAKHCDAFVAALDAPAKTHPRLERLLKSLSALERVPSAQLISFTASIYLTKTKPWWTPIIPA